MASCTQVGTLTQAFIDGELSQAETAIFKQHVAKCSRCEQTLEKQQAAAALLFEVLGEDRLQDDMSAVVLAHLPEMDREVHIDAHALTYRTKHPRARANAFVTVLSALVPALIIVLALALVVSWPPPEEKRPVVGMITQQHGTAFQSVVAGTEREGVALRTKLACDIRLETKDDAALMVGLAGPSQVKIDANSRVRIGDERKLSVETGQVWLDVCRDGRLFVVSTPAGDITVFGTAFNVEVVDGRCIVTVEEGVVQLENDVTFTEVRKGERAELAPGVKPIKKWKTDIDEALHWARAIQPNLNVQKEFEETIKPQEQTIIHAEKNLFLLSILGRPAKFISLEWDAPYTVNHCGYSVYFIDENRQPLFESAIEASIFNDPDRHSYQIAIPGDIDLRRVSVLQMRMVPDHQSGAIQTKFAEVSALSY